MNGQTWTDPGTGHALVLEGTVDADRTINVWLADKIGDGPGLNLTSAQARAVAAELLARADLIDGADATFVLECHECGKRYAIAPPHENYAACHEDRDKAYQQRERFRRQRDALQARLNTLESSIHSAIHELVDLMVNPPKDQ